jgi:hypothetical protein
MKLSFGIFRTRKNIWLVYGWNHLKSKLTNFSRYKICFLGCFAGLRKCMSGYRSSQAATKMWTSSTQGMAWLKIYSEDRWHYIKKVVNLEKFRISIVWLQYENPSSFPLDSKLQLINLLGLSRISFPRRGSSFSWQLQKPHSCLRVKLRIAFSLFHSSMHGNIN